MAIDITVAIAKKPTEKEMAFLGKIKPKAMIEVIIPDKIDPDEWTWSVATVCKALRRAEVQSQALMPVLGRLLLIASTNVTIWEHKYDKFGDFLAAEVYDKFGVKRSTCYEAMAAVSIGEPNGLIMEDYEMISRRSFRVLTKVAREISPGKPKDASVRKLIEAAKELSDDAFVEHCRQKGYIEGGGDVVGTVIRIQTSKTTEAHWNKWVSNPAVAAVCGSSNHGKILERMMEECASWIADAADAADAEAAAKGAS